MNFTEKRGKNIQAEGRARAKAMWQEEVGESKAWKGSQDGPRVEK